MRVTKLPVNPEALKLGVLGIFGLGGSNHREVTAGETALYSRKV